MAKSLGYKPSTDVDFDFKCYSLTRGVNKGLILQAIAIYDEGGSFDVNYFKALLSATPWIPVSLEESLGQKIVEEELRKGEFLDRESHRKLYSLLDREASVVLEAVKKNLGGELPYNFRFYIYDSTEKNAFSLPGGVIVVSKKLVKELLFEERWNRSHRSNPSTKRRDFLRFTLAHEISHNLKRHYSLKLQSLALSAVNDSFQARELVSQYLDDLRKLLDPKSLLKESKGKGLDRVKSFNDNLRSRTVSLLTLINSGLNRLWSSKRSIFEEYNKFEKEADACALRIASIIYTGPELEKALENFLSGLPKVSYSSSFTYSSDVPSLLSGVKENFKELVKFYVDQSNFIHPSSSERTGFLKAIYYQEYAK